MGLIPYEYKIHVYIPKGQNKKWRIYEKRLISLIFMLSITCYLVVPVGATNEEAEENTTPRIVATITDSETGDIQRVEATSQVVDVQSNPENTEIDATYSAFFPISTPQTRSNVGGSKTEGGVTVSIHVTYTISTDRELIKISQYSGSWTPSSGMFVVSNRDVGLHGGPMGHILHKTPTTNSFSYATGWGYHDFVTAGNGSPYAWADATVTVVGMSGSHALSLGMYFPDER